MSGRVFDPVSPPLAPSTSTCETRAGDQERRPKTDAVRRIDPSETASKRHRRSAEDSVREAQGVGKFLRKLPIDVNEFKPASRSSFGN